MVRSLNLFLAHKQFSDDMGGTPAPRPALRGSARNRQDAPGQGHGRARPGCRSCSCREPRSSRCTTARPLARSARTSRLCARRPGPRAARSGSSRRSTRSPWRVAVSPPPRCPRRSGMVVVLRRARGPAQRVRSGFGDLVGGVDRRQPQHHQRRCRRCRQRAPRPDAVLRRADRWAEVPCLGRSTASTRCSLRTTSSSKPDAHPDQRAAHRGDEPCRQPRPSAAAPRSLRPPADLRVAGQGGPTRPHRLLPGEEVAPPGARRGRAPRPARRGDPGLHARS